MNWECVFHSLLSGDAIRAWNKLVTVSFFFYLLCFLVFWFRCFFSKPVRKTPNHDDDDDDDEASPT